MRRPTLMVAAAMVFALAASAPAGYRATGECLLLAKDACAVKNPCGKR